MGLQIDVKSIAVLLNTLVIKLPYISSNLLLLSKAQNLRYVTESLKPNIPDFDVIFNANWSTGKFCYG